MPRRLVSLATRAADSLPASLALRLLESADPGRPDLLGVLTYHRIAPLSGVAGYPGLVSAEPGTFTDQISFIARRFRVVSLDDVLAARERGGRIGPRSVLLTFDDAYRDFAEHAWPVLKRHGLPAVLFVPTAFPDDGERPFWWDWLYDALAAAPPGTMVRMPHGEVCLTDLASRAAAFRRLRAEVKSREHADAMEVVAEIAGGQLGARASEAGILSWSDLSALHADGVVLAPHSRTHPLLDHVADGELAAEVRGSWDDLRERFARVAPAFAYPSGAWSPAARAAVEGAGFRLAFTTQRGVNRLGRTDWLTLRRINVGQSTSRNAMRAQLGSWAMAWSR